MRFLLVLSTVLILQSCELLSTIADMTSAEKPVSSYLELSNKSYNGIFHDNLYISGQIRNTHSYKTICDIVVVATITKENGTKEQQTIHVTAIDPGASTTFEKKFYVPNNTSVTLAITAAR